MELQQANVRITSFSEPSVPIDVPKYLQSILYNTSGPAALAMTPLAKYNYTAGQTWPASQSLTPMQETIRTSVSITPCSQSVDATHSVVPPHLFFLPKHWRQRRLHRTRRVCSIMSQSVRPAGAKRPQHNVNNSRPDSLSRLCLK